MDKLSLDRPMLVFDGECPFCRVWVEYGNGALGEILSEPFRKQVHSFLKSRREFRAAVKLVLPDGEVRSGAHAVFSALDAARGRNGCPGFTSEFRDLLPLLKRSTASSRVTGRLPIE